MAAIIFAIFDPVQAPKAGVMPPPLPRPTSASDIAMNATTMVRDAEIGRTVGSVGERAMRGVVNILLRDAEGAESIEKGVQSNSVVYIFR
jgi:solute carrier family 45 protein 1/2/4